jgi:hypothetical protein
MVASLSKKLTKAAADHADAYHTAKSHRVFIPSTQAFSSRMWQGYLAVQECEDALVHAREGHDMMATSFADDEPQTLKGLQHSCQPVVTEEQPVHRLPRALLQRVEALFGPGSDVVQSMVALEEDMGQLKHVHPPGTGPLSRPVGRQGVARCLGMRCVRGRRPCTNFS